MRLWLFLAAVTLMAAACGAAYPEAHPPAVTQLPTPTPTPRAAAEAPTAEEPAAAGAPVAEAGVTLRASPHAQLGTILTDDEGRTLYVFTADEPNVSNCTGGCAGVWPPLTTDGEPRAGEGVDPAGLGTIERPDGTLQVTYHSQPLYYYGADTQPGQANGQGVGGAWFVVTLEGSGAPARQRDY